MLTDRQMLILQAIIDHYTTYEEPVGSKTLAKMPTIEASSATVRNEMARLEALDLISKTHSSSGRIPVEAGYRYYINHIMPKYGGLIDSGLTDTEQEMVHEIFSDPYAELKDIITKSAETLALLSQNVVMALGPEALTQRLAGFKIVQLTRDRGMAILITHLGRVEDFVFTIPKQVSWDTLEELVNVINAEMLQLPLSTVIQRLQTETIDIMNLDKHPNNRSLVNHLVKKIDGERLVISGRQLLYQQLSSSEDFKEIHSLNEVLNNHQLLIDLMSERNKGIQVRIGKELEQPKLENMSLMTANIGTDQNDHDLIFAVLGPENMPYLKMVQLVHGIRSELNRFLDDYQSKL